MKKYIPYFFLLSVFVSCIEEDIINDTVSEKIRITNPLNRLAINESYDFDFQYLNNVGKEEAITPSWSVSNNLLANINENTGVVSASSNLGETTVRISYINPEGKEIFAEDSFTISNTTEEESSTIFGTIAATSFYDLEGTFQLSELEDGRLMLEFEENYLADTSLPGLYIYLTNNPNTPSDGYEIGRVNVFRGAHSYTIPAEIKINQFNFLLYWCKPFSVRVGGGEL